MTDLSQNFKSQNKQILRQSNGNQLYTKNNKTYFNNSELSFIKSLDKNGHCIAENGLTVWLARKQRKPELE